MFTGQLLDFQVDSANKLCQRKKELLALPQGLGKTIVSLASLEKLLELQLITNVLILCPTGIAWQWEEKIKEFTDGNDVKLVKAADKSSRIYKANEAVYTIVPYSILRRDYKRLLPLPYDLVIADEAQEFSSFRAQTHKIIRKFKPPYRWALTGTAISNKLEELYAILQWVDPYCLPHWQKFEKLHIIRNPYTKQILGYKNLDSLNKYLLSTRLDRKTIEELQDKLPEVVTHKLYIEKSKEVERYELSLYNILVSRNVNISNVSKAQFDPEISQALHATRQALTKSKIEYVTTLLRKLLAESDNNRIVLYSFYKEPLQQLAEYGVLFTGDQGQDDKARAIKAFREGETRVLLSSNAGKAGLDLPFANYTIHLDVPFSYGVSDQRSTRTRRISSHHSSVIVIYLLVKHSVDEYYYYLVNNKAALSEAVLEGGADKLLMRSQSLTQYMTKFYGNKRKSRAI